MYVCNKYFFTLQTFENNNIYSLNCKNICIPIVKIIRKILRYPNIKMQVFDFYNIFIKNSFHILNFFFV